MSNRRAIVFLLLAIAALAVAEALLSAGGSRGRARWRAFLVDGAPDFTAVDIVRGGRDRTTLVRDREWRMTRPFAAEVEASAVMKLVDALTQTPVSESVSDDELLRMGRSRADFALETPPLEVVLSNDTARADVAFGTLTASGDGVYAAVGGERRVYIVPSSVLAAVDVPVDRLRRRRIFRREAETVAAFDIRQSSGRVLSFTRDGEGWRLGAEPASAEVVSGLLGSLCAAEATGFAWPTGAADEGRQASASLLAGYGLDPETAVTVTIKGLGGASESVSFGKPASGDGVYAFVHGGGSVVTVVAALKDAAAQDAARFVDPRLFRTAAEKVSSLTIADGGVTLALERDDQGRWRLASPVSAMADSAAAESLLAHVLALTSSDLRPEGTSVAVGADAKPVTVVRSAVFPDGGGFEALRSSEVVNFAAGEVRRLVSVSSNGAPVSVAYVRDRRAWVVESAPDGAVVSDEGVARVLAALSPLRALRVARLKASAVELAEFGLDRPSMSLAVDLDREGSARRNVIVGGDAPDGVFATVGAADAVFVIPREARNALASPLTR